MSCTTVIKHFVTFYSPGTFVPESSSREIDSWDPTTALALAAGITERHGARPYAFQFTTRSRGPEDLDSRVSQRSGFYYLPHCKVETLEEIRERDDPRDEILLSNMRCNKYDRVVTTTTGWKTTLPLGEDDVVLEESA